MFAGDAIDANEMCQYCCGDDVSCGISERELGKLNQEAAHLNFFCFVRTLSHMVFFLRSALSLGGFRLCGQFWQMSVANVVVLTSIFQIVFKWLLLYHLFRRLDSQLGT